MQSHVILHWPMNNLLSRFWKFSFFSHVFTRAILPPSAGIHVYYPWPCVCLCPSVSCVCHKSVFYRKGRTDWSVLSMETFRPVLHRVIRKFRYIQKLGYFPLELYPKLRTKYSPRHIDRRNVLPTQLAKGGYSQRDRLDCRWSINAKFIPPARHKTVLSVSRQAVWIESQDSLAKSEQSADRSPSSRDV